MALCEVKFHEVKLVCMYILEIYTLLGIHECNMPHVTLQGHARTGSCDAFRLYYLRAKIEINLHTHTGLAFRIRSILGAMHADLLLKLSVGNLSGLEGGASPLKNQKLSRMEGLISFLTCFNYM